MSSNEWNVGSPERKDFYLVTLQMPEGDLEVDIRYYDPDCDDSWAGQNGWTLECGSVLDEVVVAWMELPKPYNV